MLAANFGKYKNIIFSIALFLILDASVLTLNFYMSFQFAEDAVGVNLAGRQRMLSQRTVKSLLDIDYSFSNGQDPAASLTELSQAVVTFDRTLTAFDVGGLAPASNGGDMYLKPVNSAAGRAAIEQAKAIWGPYKSRLDSISASGADLTPVSLLAVISYARDNNVQLLGLMNTLTVDLETIARSKASRLRTIQTVGISLAIINFFIILFHFIGQLRTGDRQLDLARQETTKILDTVKEGLFLVDKKLLIGSQHSSNVPGMFGREEITGLSLEGLLSDLVTSKDMETSKRFIGLLFREEIKSNLISDLNPLREIEVNIPDQSGGYDTHYLSFDFARAYEHDVLMNVLVTVNDITEKVRLEQELELVKEQTEQQLEVLTGILHANPKMLKRFVEGCFEGFARINRMLREPAKSERGLRQKLQAIFVEIHNFKGEAGALGLESFQELAHKFESDVAVIKEKSKIVGDDFFPLVVQLEKLIRHSETVKNLSDKLRAFAADDKSVESQVSDQGEWDHLHNLVSTIATRHGKKVELVTCGLSEVAMSSDMKRLVSEVSVQCIRNAICHGIETPPERVAGRKTEVGRIELRTLQTSDGRIEFTVMDDGRGLDYESIRDQAVKRGLYSAQELNTWGTKQLVSLIFEPGFSTAQDKGMDAGRGVGMDVIKGRIKAAGGRIKISSRRGLNTHFVITFPEANTQELAA